MLCSRLICLLFLALPTLVWGQDVEDIGRKLKNFSQEALRIDGGLSLSNDFYLSDGIDPRRDDLQWRMRARLNLNFLGVNAPFTLNFSDGNQAYGLPSYTFLGISPRYKWAQLHLGDRSLNFSRYTLNGINFRGAGLELTPGKFYLGAMYGRLRRAVAEDLIGNQQLDPAYERWGWGLKTGYRSSKRSINFIYFAAWDDPNSIFNPVESDIQPGENAIISLNGFQKIGKKFKFDVDFARSAFNRDRRVSELEAKNLSSSNQLFGLFTPNNSASLGNAYTAGLSYFGKGFSLRTSYGKIDRGYRTFGAIFFNNDQENLTLNLTKSLLRNKLSLSLTGGIERTNLDELESIATSRWVGSANLSYTPTQKWNLSANFSNFQNSTTLRTSRDVGVFVDSIFLAQLTQSVSFTATRTLGTSIDPASISLIITQQSANSVINDEVQDDLESRFTNVGLLYNRRYLDQDLQLNGMLNLNRSVLNGLTNLIFSPTIGLSKDFWDRQLTTNARLTYNSVFVGGQQNSTVWNITLGADYTFLKDHKLGLNTSFIIRSTTSDLGNDFSELFGRLLYTYRFSSQRRHRSITSLQ